MLTRLLGEIAREYHQLQVRHQARGRDGAGNAAHRRLGHKMAELADRFERLLEHWAPEPGIADAWRQHLRGRGPRPDGPDLAEPPLFRGTTDGGARIEVRRTAGNDGVDEVDIFCDGARIARESGPWTLEAEAIEPVTIAGQVCIDSNDASPDAISALRDFIARPGREPPWRFARELYEDGLIDIDFALTARGGRCLARLGADRPTSRGRAARARPGGTRARYCVIVADAARARILLLATTDSGLAPTLMPLTEVADLSRPQGRARDRDLHSESRPGQRADTFAGASSGHTVSDHRDSRRRETSREFAEDVADAASRVWRTLPACEIVVVASPSMLGHLRPAIARRSGGAIPHNVHELARDLSKLAPAALHDALATAGHLPPRGRREPLPRLQREVGPRRHR